MEVRILGPVSAIGSDGPVLLGNPKQRALLARLSLSPNRVVSTTQLIDDLWGASPPGSAANAVQVYVSRLRKVLTPDGTELLTRRPGYLLKSDPDHIDAFLFERLVTEAREALETAAGGIALSKLDRALGLWQGEALADVAGEPFAPPHIARLEDLRDGAEEERIDALLSLGRHHEAINDLERMVAEKPLRERRWGQLMLGLYRAGRQADALRSFQRARAVLAEELGVDPGPDLAALEDAILQQDNALRHAPSDMTVLNTGDDGFPGLPLTGRSDAKAALLDGVRLVAGGGRVAIDIVGAAGSGKGALIRHGIELARRHSIEARVVEVPPGAIALPGWVAAQLDLATATGRCAIFVEGIEWADATSLTSLGRFVAEENSLLVTARDPLGSDRPLSRFLETVRRAAVYSEVRIGPLTTVDLEEVMEPSVARLLIKATAGIVDDVERIVTRWLSEGLLVRQDGRLIAPGDLPDPGRSSIAARLEELDSESRLLVEAASLARVPIGLGVAARMLEVSEARALEIGEQLSTTGFLAVSTDGLTARHRAGAGQVRGLLSPLRIAFVYGKLADAHEKSEGAPHHPEILGGYLFDAGRWEESLDLLAPIALQLVTDRAYEEALPILEQAMVALEKSAHRPRRLEGRLRLARARCYRLAGWPSEASRDLTLAVRFLDGADRAEALEWQARIVDDRQQPQAAEPAVAMAELEAHDADAAGLQGALLTLHARVLSRLGFADESRAALEKGLALVEREGSDFQVQSARYDAAWIAMDCGELVEAEAAFGRLADRAADQQAERSDLLAWRARALFGAGRPDEALTVYDEAVKLAGQTANVGPLFLSHLALTEGAALYGAYDDALVAADDMLDVVLRQIPAWENAARHARARALTGLGLLAEAHHEVLNAIDLSPKGVDGRRWALRCRTVLMDIDGRLGAAVDETEARRLVEELLEGGWSGAAGEALVVVASIFDDAEAARQAATLAVSLRQPVAAGAAVAAGNLWDEPVGRTVAAEVARVGRRVPRRWRSGWEVLGFGG